MSEWGKVTLWGSVRSWHRRPQDMTEFCDLVVLFTSHFWLWPAIVFATLVDICHLVDLEVGEILLKRGEVEGAIIESQRAATSAECVKSAWIQIKKFLEERRLNGRERRLNEILPYMVGLILKSQEQRKWEHQFLYTWFLCLYCILY